MFKELLKRVAAALDSEGIPYMIIGGQAVLFHGEPRFTKDIDITLGVDTSALERVKALISNLSLDILVNNIDDFVNKTMVLPSLDATSGIRVDLIFSYSLYERQAIERAVDAAFDTVSVRMASLEDVVIHKIIAGRPRDIEDIKSVLLKNPNFNREYILRWLGQFDDSLQEGFARRFEDIEKELN